MPKSRTDSGSVSSVHHTVTVVIGAESDALLIPLELEVNPRSARVRNRIDYH